MSKQMKALPREAVALVQHIELNRSGWWEKTVDRLILAAIWISDAPINQQGIKELLKQEFKLPIGDQKLGTTITKLESRGDLICFDDGICRISDSQRIQLEQEIREAEIVEANAKAFFRF